MRNRSKAEPAELSRIRHRPGRARLWIAFLLSVALLQFGLPKAASATDITALGLSCVAEHGTRFCEGGPGLFVDNRTPSWDGLPLDADVILPPTGDGPWPLLVMLAPWSFPKGLFEATAPDKGIAGFTGKYYNSNYFARNGYAVLSYTPRGVVDSCGPIQGSILEGNGLGPFRCPDDNWTHFADQRYEIRDAQYLAGLLVDEGVAEPAIAVTGESYGAGQTLELSTLNNRTVTADNTVVEWASPGGTPMSIKAAVAVAAWSDFAYSILPNGRWRDDSPVDPNIGTEPLGVVKDWLHELYVTGLGTVVYGNVEEVPGAAMPDWVATFDTGAPYSKAASTIVRSMQEYHSSLYIPGDVGPAPTMIIQGWTDDLFTPIHAIAWYNRTRQRFPDTDVALRLASIGHSRAQNKPADTDATSDEAIKWLDHYMKGKGSLGPQVQAWTVTCPESAPSGGPYSADSWETLSKGSVKFNGGAKTFGAEGGRDEVNWAIDPVPLLGDFGFPWPGPAPLSGTLLQAINLVGSAHLWTPWPKADACREVQPDSGDIAHWEFPAGDYTALGLPEITANIEVRNGNPDGEMSARLWDYDPSTGMQRLITKGWYRLDGNQTGTIDWQLNGAAWLLDSSREIHLDIVGRDYNNLQPSNNTDFEVTLNNVELAIPTAEAVTNAPTSRS